MRTAITALAAFGGCAAARRYLGRHSKAEYWGGRVRLTTHWNEGAAFGLPIPARALPLASAAALGLLWAVREQFSGPEYLLVDGYNIIFAWDELKSIAAESLDAARKALCDILCNYQGYRKCVVIAVFDAYKVRGGQGSVEKYHNIYVVYTKEAETADAYIERATYEIGKQHRVKVATSDGPEQLIILGHGALRISASGFREEVEQVRGQISDLLARNNRQNKNRGALRAAMEKAREEKE